MVTVVNFDKDTATHSQFTERSRAMQQMADRKSVQIKDIQYIAFDRHTLARLIQLPIYHATGMLYMFQPARTYIQSTGTHIVSTRCTCWWTRSSRPFHCDCFTSITVSLSVSFTSSSGWFNQCERTSSYVQSTSLPAPRVMSVHLSVVSNVTI